MLVLKIWQISCGKYSVKVCAWMKARPYLWWKYSPEASWFIVEATHQFYSWTYLGTLSLYSKNTFLSDIDFDTILEFGNCLSVWMNVCLLTTITLKFNRAGWQLAEQLIFNVWRFSEFEPITWKAVFANRHKVWCKSTHFPQNYPWL
jgi:hypothetical protein